MLKHGDLVECENRFEHHGKTEAEYSKTAQLGLRSETAY